MEIALKPNQKLVVCKQCKGSGHIVDFVTDSICTSCKGLGRRIAEIQPNRTPITCGTCKGSGNIADFLTVRKCPVCDGLGFTYPKLISSGTEVSSDKKTLKLSQGRTNYDYDIAISFAGEDRPIVDGYANRLRTKGIKVFYDKYEQVDLWGEDLYERLDDVYRNKARYCVIFISSHYAQKLWTTHERKSAQARAFRENKTYILPVKVDDTSLPGIRETVGYIDLQNTSLEQLTNLTIQKLAT